MYTDCLLRLIYKKIGRLQYSGLANVSCIVRCAGCGRHNTCMQYLNNESRNKSTNVTDTYVHTYYHIDVQYTISPTHMYMYTVLAHAYVPTYTYVHMYTCTYCTCIKTKISSCTFKSPYTNMTSSHVYCICAFRG